MMTLPFEGSGVNNGYAGLAFAPDGPGLAVATHTRVTVFPDPADPAGAFTAEYPFLLGHVAYLADGRVVANGFQRVPVYDPGGGAAAEIRCDGPVRALAAAPGGRALWLAVKESIGPRYALRRYDAAAGAFVGPPVNSVGEAWVLAGAGGVLVCGGKKTVRAWRPAGDTPPKRAAMVKKLPGGWVTGVAASADGRYVAGSARKVAVVWDVAAGAEVCRVSHKQVVKGVAFHPRGAVLATASTDGTVAFWDAATGAKRHQFAWKVGPLYAVAFAPDGLRCAALGEYQVVVWDVE